uniref:Integrin alpha FG-GAP repeat containing 1 n=1 Tax=Gadus morhua TaxID=8049 RepID=A0A8C5FA32_GADMO
HQPSSPCFLSVAVALQDVTADLFGTENYGTVAAFGDFNSDKQTDLFIIRNQSELVIFLADVKIPYFKPKFNISKDSLPRDSIITSVVPGDYDGDSQMDVLLTTSPKLGEDTTVFIFWGNNQTLGKATGASCSCFNGDMIPDVFGILKDGSTEVCLLKDRLVEWHKALSASVKMRVPHSNAFVDLNMDFTADLFLTTQDNHFETWINKDHLLPVCLDEACRSSAIYLAGQRNKEWVTLLSDFQQGETKWGLVPGAPGLPLALHLGDYNLDGFPDALVILRNSSSRAQRAFLLENVPCSGSSCPSVGRTFRVHWDQSDMGSIPQAALATFYDIYEDGILDMLVLSRAEGKADFIIHALKNNFEADAYFVKVIVLSGLCSSDCPQKVTPFGVNQPGPYVMYTTVDSNGNLKNASAGQLSQSAHLSLQLPYIVLGLGRSANFLDHLYVGIPRPPGETVSTNWSAKLYLTPSSIVLLTAIALIGVCVFILIIIGILHWKEKRKDFSRVKTGHWIHADMDIYSDI